ncbi:MAG TPA: hypothetical protein VFF13_00390 [archaeon]|nr:hypothetical protein [archaeon]
MEKKKQKNLTYLFEEAKQKNLVENEDYRMYLNLITNLTNDRILAKASFFVAIIVFVAAAYIGLLQIHPNPNDPYVWVVSVAILIAIIFIYHFGKKMISDSEKDIENLYIQFEEYFKFKESNKPKPIVKTKANQKATAQKPAPEKPKEKLSSLYTILKK